jgi:hypothetical protein
MSDRFFIVGAQRCGTTYLYHLLDAHPEIEMARPVRPEPKFFLDDARFDQGLKHYDQAYFQGKRGARLKGEKSTSYLESDTAARRIAGAFPRARILVLLRDPIARAVSHWRFSVENGVEDLPLEEAFRQEAERRDRYDRERFSVSPWAYLKRGRYIDDILRWEKLFPRERIGVFLYEALLAAPETLANLYGFLGADPAFVPERVGERINPSAEPPAGAETLSAETTQWLGRYFAEPNARLAVWMGMDLSRWWKRTPENAAR